MGRPPIKRDLKVRKTTVWLHQEQIDRITEVAGPNRLSDFLRDAADAELKRRERLKPRKAQGITAEAAGSSEPEG